MAVYNLQLPKMGESVSEATVVKWLKQPGDSIEEDEPVLEIATDKVDSDVPSPVSGILKEQRFSESDVAQVGDVIAIIETEGDDEEAQASELSNLPDEVGTMDDDAVASDIPGMEQLEEVVDAPPSQGG